MRNVTVLAALACIAVGVHLWLTRESAPEVVEKVRVTQDQAPQPAATEVTIPLMVPPEDRELAIRSLSLEDARGREQSDAPAGLTSDLMLRPANSDGAALEGVASPSAAAPTGSQTNNEGKPEHSLRELYELAEQAKKQPKAFEPWSEQAPEAEPPAAPAPNDR